MVESLRNSKGRLVVVATDVAARGLDIPSVATVLHYDAARNVQTFVHRSGRTAVSHKSLLPCACDNDEHDVLWTRVSEARC